MKVITKWPKEENISKYFGSKKEGSKGKMAKVRDQKKELWEKKIKDRKVKTKYSLFKKDLKNTTKLITKNEA